MEMKYDLKPKDVLADVKFILDDNAMREYFIKLQKNHGALLELIENELQEDENAGVICRRVFLPILHLVKIPTDKLILEAATERRADFIATGVDPADFMYEEYRVQNSDFALRIRILVSSLANTLQVPQEEIMAYLTNILYIIYRAKQIENQFQN